MNPGRKDLKMGFDRREFVGILNDLVTAAMPNIKGLVLACPGETSLMIDCEHVIAVCDNGAQYKICTEADSLMALAYDVIKVLMHK